MTKNELLKRFNATETIINNLPKIIEGFVNFYGEEERERIESKFKNLIICGYHSPKDFKLLLSSMDREKNSELEDRFYKDLNISGDKKEELGNKLFLGKIRFQDNFNDINFYIKALNGNREKYVKERVVRFLSKFAEGINMDNIDQILESGGLLQLSAMIDKYQELSLEYQAYINETKMYRDYVSDGEKLMDKLISKYEKEFVYSLGSLFTEEEMKLIEDEFNKPYPVPRINGKAKNYFSSSLLVGVPLIDAFSEENEEILNGGTSWRTTSIIDDRISYFKNLGFDLGNDYQSYLESEEVRRLVPSKETIKLINDKRKEFYTKAMNEFYQSLPNYIQDRERIDRESLINKDDGYDAKTYENKKTCVISNAKIISEKIVGYPILCLCATSGEEFLDQYLIHELNHVFEFGLQKIEGKRYVFSSGWDILEDEIEEKEKDIVSLDENREKRDYELFSEIINELLSQEITGILHDNGVYIFNQAEDAKIKGGSGYEIMKVMVEYFYLTYKKEIMNSRKNGNMDQLFERVGRENFEALNALVKEFFDNFKGFAYVSMINDLKEGKVTDRVRKFKEMMNKRDQILTNMNNYSLVSSKINL